MALSRFAQRFVAHKLEQLTRQAEKGSGLHYELFAQNFTDSVDRLARRVKRPDLREHLFSEAEKTGNYFGEDAAQGRWVHDVENNDLRWQGEPLDWMKTVDGHGQWVAKSPTEKARLVLGHFGEDSRTQRDYPGIQVEKNGVVGEVRWGPEQPTAQDARIHAEKMLDAHLGFSAPVLQPSSMLDIRKSAEMSEHLGADVRAKAWKKYAKQCAKTLTSAAEKYGHASDSQQREITPPSRSR